MYIEFCDFFFVDSEFVKKHVMNNPELDALSKMVVDKVLEKIKNSSDGGLNRGKHLFKKREE